MSYRFKKRSWMHARWRRVDHVILLVLLISFAFVRGLDYLIGDDVWNAQDFMLAAAPGWVWGVVGYISGATILLFGVLQSRHFYVWLGHAWLAITYFVTALATVLATSWPYFDGIRGGGSLTTIAFLHLVLALRTGPAPLRVRGRSRVDEVTIVDRKG